MLDAARGPKSRSHFIIDAIRQQSMCIGVHIPTSLGIADGFYGATVHDDVVDLANQLAALEYLAMHLLDRLPKGRDSDDLKLRLIDARLLLNKLAGQPVETRQ